MMVAVLVRRLIVVGDQAAGLAVLLLLPLLLVGSLVAQRELQAVIGRLRKPASCSALQVGGVAAQQVERRCGRRPCG